MSTTSNLPRTLKALTDSLTQLCAENDRVMPKMVYEVLEATNVDPDDLLPYADYDHPPEDCYGRKLVYHGGNYEVMVMSWAPWDHSSIHNHGHTEWGVVQVFGDAMHAIYRERDNQLQFVKREILANRTLTLVNNATIHQMGNPSNDRYLTLHVYGCNNPREEITGDAKNYELEFERINHTTGGAFFNLPDSEIYDIQDCPTPDVDVFTHYFKVLLDYYRRLPTSDKTNDLIHQLINKLEAVYSNR